MLTTKDFDGHVIVEYKRNSKKEPVGVVVATGAGIIGWALCNKNDTFNKAFGLHIALTRATKMASLTQFGRRDFVFDKLPFTLTDLYNKVEGRSNAYFKSAE